MNRMTNLALKLIEGTKADRDKYIDKVEVLDRVKRLVMLPDDKYVKTSDIAEYYNVSDEAIRSIYNRHKKEFEHDGVISLRGETLRKYKNRIQSLHNATIKGNAQLTLHTRTSTLRIGMLLTTSSVAEKVRDYLLLIESNTLQSQKESTLRYMGEWTQEIENYVLNGINNKRSNGVGLGDAITEVAIEIGATRSLINARWYGTGGYKKDALKNKKPKLTSIQKSKISTVNNNDKDLEKHFINQNKIMMDLMHEIKEVKSINEKLQKDNDRLHSDMGKLWRGYKELENSFDNVTKDIQTIKRELNTHNKLINETYIEKVNILEKRIDTQSKKLKATRKELEKAKLHIADINLSNSITPYESKGNSFKMDRNGNLTKM